MNLRLFAEFPEKKILLGHAAMLSFSLLVSLSFVFGSKVANSIDPLAITFARFFMAMLFIGAICTLKFNFNIASFRAPWRFLILGFAITLYFVLMFEGLKTAKPVSMSIVFTLTPIMAGLFDFLISKKRMPKPVTFALVIGALGAVWVIFEGDLNRLLLFNLGRGEALFFFGCMGHALYAALIPVLNRGETALFQTFGTLVSCSLLLSIVGLSSIYNTDWLSLSFFTWFTIIYLALFATSASFFLIQFSASRLSSVKVMAYTYAVPIWVLLFNWLFGSGLPDSSLMWGGIVIVFVLIFLLRNKDY